MVWLEPTNSTRTAAEPNGAGAWIGGVLVIDEGLWMADWEAELVDWRRYEDRHYGGGIVDEIMEEACVASRCEGATFLGPVARGPRYSYSNPCKEVDEKMDETTRQKMSEYLELFDAIKAKINNEQVALALFQEVAKDVRSDKRATQTQEGQDAKGSEPATKKQKEFMRKLGLKYPANVTKLEASALLDEELGKNGNDGN